jgi:sulfide dehydrogenase [flavocytochrome c] flavoprotein subunit
MPMKLPSPPLLSRRHFTQAVVAAAALSAVGRAKAQAPRARVVVVGGGFGGATAAKYLRLLDAALDITLIEPNASFVTCPFSNDVLIGRKAIGEITHDYRTLSDVHKIKVLQDTATAIDPARHVVTVASGGTLPYDRLVVSPGIDFHWDAIQGYDEAAAELLPHAWKAGPQTLLLRRQIEAMDDGGVFLIVAPPNPYRCPPAIYERASLLAHYFKQRKPRSKILILDAKDQFPAQGQFQDGWTALYGDMIEWVALSQDGRVTEAIAAEKAVISEFGERHEAAVLNVVPPQMAGRIARDAGLANQTGWCPVDPLTFESTLHKDIHVIGDACLAGAMPKGGFAANSQAKVTALAIVNALRGRPPAAPTYANICYAFLAPDYAISVVDVFRPTPEGITPVPEASGISPRNAGAGVRADEARFAEGWYAAMTTEIWRS